MIFIASLLIAALSVVPVYTNHNRVAGSTATMTNIAAWAAAVESAIGSGGGGVDTNAVKDIISSAIPHNEQGFANTASYALNAASANCAEVATTAYGLTDTTSPTVPWKGQVDERVASASVTNLGAVAAATSAAAAQAAARFLPLSGGTMTGGIYLGGTRRDDSKKLMFYNAELLGGIKGLQYLADYNLLCCDLPFWADGYKVLEWDTISLMDGETLPDYLASTAWHGSNKSLGDYGITNRDVSAAVDSWDSYWRGDNVRLSVTNYYGNTSGEPPRLRIEEFDHSETNGTVVSNYYHIVWDEVTRQTNYQAQIERRVDTISNSVMTATWQQTNNQLANKAPRAWQTVTSAGEDAPANTVWHTAPNTVFAGGTEYAHVAVGEGTICVLVDQGAPVFTEGAEGQFRFTDESGENYFGFDVRSAYTLGCRTDGISVDPSEHLVSLTYDLTASSNPTVLHCTNITENVWTEATVTWEQNPPAGSMICYIDVGTNPAGFYKAQIEYAGGAKFITNMQADLAGGIAASNEVNNVIQSIVPYITSSGIVWRVKQ